LALMALFVHCGFSQRLSSEGNSPKLSEMVIIPEQNELDTPLEAREETGLTDETVAHRNRAKNSRSSFLAAPFQESNAQQPYISFPSPKSRRMYGAIMSTSRKNAGHVISQEQLRRHGDRDNEVVSRARRSAPLRGQRDTTQKRLRGRALKRKKGFLDGIDLGRLNDIEHPELDFLGKKKRTDIAEAGTRENVVGAVEIDTGVGAASVGEIRSSPVAIETKAAEVAPREPPIPDPTAMPVAAKKPSPTPESTDSLTIVNTEFPTILETESHTPDSAEAQTATPTEVKQIAEVTRKPVQPTLFQTENATNTSTQVEFAEVVRRTPEPTETSIPESMSIPGVAEISSREPIGNSSAGTMESLNVTATASPSPRSTEVPTQATIVEMAEVTHRPTAPTQDTKMDVTNAPIQSLVKIAEMVRRTPEPTQGTTMDATKTHTESLVKIAEVVRRTPEPTESPLNDPNEPPTTVPIVAPSATTMLSPTLVKATDSPREPPTMAATLSSSLEATATEMPTATSSDSQTAAATESMTMVATVIPNMEATAIPTSTATFSLTQELTGSSTAATNESPTASPSLDASALPTALTSPDSTDSPTDVITEPPTIEVTESPSPEVTEDSTPKPTLKRVHLIAEVARGPPEYLEDPTTDPTMAPITSKLGKRAGRGSVGERNRKGPQEQLSREWTGQESKKTTKYSPERDWIRQRSEKPTSRIWNRQKTRRSESSPKVRGFSTR
jgi:hypothetical protein